jgi:hypothetical protein
MPQRPIDIHGGSEGVTLVRRGVGAPEQPQDRQERMRKKYAAEHLEVAGNCAICVC